MGSKPPNRLNASSRVRSWACGWLYPTNAPGAQRRLNTAGRILRPSIGESCRGKRCRVTPSALSRGRGKRREPRGWPPQNSIRRFRANFLDAAGCAAYRRQSRRTARSRSGSSSARESSRRRRPLSRTTSDPRAHRLARLCRGVSDFMAEPGGVFRLLLWCRPCRSPPCSGGCGHRPSATMARSRWSLLGDAIHADGIGDRSAACPVSVEIENQRVQQIAADRGGKGLVQDLHEIVAHTIGAGRIGIHPLRSGWRISAAPAGLPRPLTSRDVAFAPATTRSVWAARKAKNSGASGEKVT